MWLWPNIPSLFVSVFSITDGAGWSKRAHRIPSMWEGLGFFLRSLPGSIPVGSVPWVWKSWPVSLSSGVFNEGFLFVCCCWTFCLFVFWTIHPFWMCPGRLSPSLDMYVWCSEYYTNHKCSAWWVFINQTHSCILWPGEGGEVTSSSVSLPPPHLVTTPSQGDTFNLISKSIALFVLLLNFIHMVSYRMYFFVTGFICLALCLWDPSIILCTLCLF